MLNKLHYHINTHETNITDEKCRVVNILLCFLKVSYDHHCCIYSKIQLNTNIAIYEQIL